MTTSRPQDQEPLLARVWKARKAAVPVWVALTLIATQKGKKHFAIKRRTLARLSGIERIPTVSEALAALERLGVIKRQVRRCRRPDGTLFHRLRIRVIHQITKNVSIHQVRKTRYAPGTAPDNEKREHSPGTPDNEKRYTSPIGDDSACGVLKTPQRTHVAPADAAGARRVAQAPRRTPAGATCHSAHIDSLSSQARAAIEQLAEQIGCTISAFEFENGVATLEAAGLFLFVQRNGTVSFAANVDASITAWTASADQVSLVRKALALAKERRPHFWNSGFSDDQVDLARAITLRVDCRLADWEALGRFLMLGDSNFAGCVRIHQNGKVSFATTGDGRQVEEPWHGTEAQIECVRQALQRKRG
jgi:hypothetical protein